MKPIERKRVFSEIFGRTLLENGYIEKKHVFYKLDNQNEMLKYMYMVSLAAGHGVKICFDIVPFALHADPTLPQSKGYETFTLDDAYLRMKGTHGRAFGTDCCLEDDFRRVMVTDEGVEGKSIETLQNIHIHPIYNSYLAHKDDYMSEMKREKEILSKVIRNLNEIDNLKKYDAWFEKNVEIIDGVYLVRLPYLLIYREYEKACKIMTQYRLEEEHAYEKIQIEYKCEFDKIKEMLPMRFKTYKEFGELIHAIHEKNDDQIEKILNQWKTEAYHAIEKRSKTFCKKYPIVLFRYGAV